VYAVEDGFERLPLHWMWWPAIGAIAVGAIGIRRRPVVAFADWSLRDAADEMVRQGVGRLPVVEQTDLDRPVGIITRSDLLRAHTARLDDLHRRNRPVIARWHRKRRDARAASHAR
jgi:CBS domain containing-hemolysin-like protein